MLDTPRLTQRSIIAYCKRTAENGAAWADVVTRTSVAVVSLTAATLKINGASSATLASGKLKVEVNGSGVKLMAKADGDAFDASVNFALTVTTAGDAAADLEGTTASFNINVLLLGADLPYSEETFVAFHVGETMPEDGYVLSMIKHAGIWTTYAANTGFGVGASGGQKILSNTKDASGNYTDSGLILHCQKKNDYDEDPTIWISGTAARPGVYRVYFDLDTSGGNGSAQLKYGNGHNPLIIWIYTDWIVGDLVVGDFSPTRLPGNYVIWVAHAPNFGGGLGYELNGVEFFRVEEPGDPEEDEPETVVRWRGARIYRTRANAVSIAYHYVFQNTWHNDPGVNVWELYGATNDSADPPETVSEMTLLASHDGDDWEFADAVPPKQGWDAEDLVVNGDAVWYVSEPATDAGWYSYAGVTAVYPPDGDPFEVEVYEREKHFVQGYAGWNFGGITGDGVRYLVRVAGAWRIISSAWDLQDWDAIITSRMAIVELSYMNAVVPFAPAKLDDVGVLVDVPAGDLAPVDAVTKVVHSLSNSFAESGEFALLMDGIAGAFWKQYPLRRLLHLFKVGATVTMHLSATKRHEAHQEIHNPSGESPESDNTGDYADGIPSVAQVEEAGGSLTVTQCENWIKSDSVVTASASTDVTFALSYAIWSSSFPKYLEGLLNRSTAHTNSTSSYSHDAAGSGKSSLSSKTYRVESISKAEAISRGIPFPGDGQGEAATWEITGASARFSWRYYDGSIEEWYDEEWVRFTYDPATGTWSSTASDWWVSTAFVPSVSIDPSSGVLSVAMTEELQNHEIGRRVSGSGTPAAGETTVSASASQTWSGPNEYEIDIEDMTVSISATGAKGSPGDSPGADGPHGGVPDPNDPDKVKVVFVAVEMLGGSETETLGSPSTAGGHDFEAHGTTSLFFGEGRESNWPHRVICAAAGGEGGVSVSFTATNAQREEQLTVTHGGSRRRGSGGDEWSYGIVDDWGHWHQTGDPETWGTTTTTNEVNTELPETLTDGISGGTTFNTGVAQLLLAYLMGTLSASYSTTGGSASGSAFGYRQNPQTGEEDSADIPSVSGSWTRISGSSTNAPSGSETRGIDVSGSVDLSGEIDGDEWEQWGYSYEISTTTTSASVQIEITDADFPAPVE